jgi:uncharacterized membrane protein YeiH
MSAALLIGPIAAAPVPLEELQIPLAVNLVAVAVGALVGTLTAADEEDVDVVGMFALALCFGFGGGLVRDILLGNLPPAALREPAYLITVLVATVVGSVFLVYLDHFERPLAVMDSLSVGLFASVGVNASLLAGLALLPSILIGTVASVGGLLIADTLRARPSALLYKGPPVVLAGLAGAATYAVLYDNVNTVIVTVLAVGASFAVRMAGYLWGVQAPMPIRERHELRRRVRQLWAKVGAHPRGWVRGSDDATA